MFTVRWISIGAFPLCLPVARTWIALQAFVSFLLTFRTHSCAEEGVDQRWLSNSALCSIEKFGVERTPQIFPGRFLTELRRLTVEMSAGFDIVGEEKNLSLKMRT
jgi:hypothetical protein